nr:retrotransposon protein, putative, Ty1-copia subclass [Tanacetum cinerariifolium]
MGKTVTEFHAMLKLHEQTLPPKEVAPALHAIRKKLSQGASTSGIFIIELYSIPSTSWVYDTGYGTHMCITTQGLRGSKKLKPGALSLRISKKRIEKLQHDGLLDSTDIKSFEKVSERRNRTLLDMVRSMMIQTTLPKSFWDYALEFAVRILNMVPTKKVDKTPYKVWHGQAPKLSYLKVWGSSGSLEDLVIIQEEDTHPFLDTSLNHEEDDQEIDEPQNDSNPIRRSTRTRRTPDQMCLYIDSEDHELGDLGIDYKETFSPVVDIRAIRILIAIAAFYDYEIWQMDVKTAFLNGYLNKKNPGEVNWTIVKNILKYLRNTKDMFLVYRGDMKQEIRVSCYTDAGYLTDADDIRLDMNLF